MRIEMLLVLLALFILAVAPARAETQRTILFGVNYIPHVTGVDDFRPFWTTDNWTEKRLVSDLKIMKAIGCSAVRFHIYPAVPGQIASHSVAAERFLTQLDLGVETAQDLGLSVHLDLADYVDERGEESVQFCLNRYKGRIESYQIGNERYDYPESPEKLKWLQGLLELGHSIDPAAKMSADIMVPDWIKIRDEMPELYKQLDVGLAHYYPVTDYNGWNDLYIEDLVDHLGNPIGRDSAAMKSYDHKRSLKDFGEYDAKSLSFDHDLYVGSWGWLDKEVWITEIAAHGYWRWGNLTPEAKRAADWERVVDAVAAGANRVTRIYHHCFRDKMHTREFGMGQSGIVYHDNAPRPSTFAFKKMAAKYAPADSTLRTIDCEIERISLAPGSAKAELRIKLINKTDKPLSGKALLELPDNVTAAQTTLNFTLPSGGDQLWSVEADVSNIHWGTNHLFARLEIPQGVTYGWGVITSPKRIEVNPVSPLGPEGEGLVRYASELAAVEEFFQKYGDDCAIITGPCLGSDAEMGHRLKSVLQAMRGREVPVRGWILAQEVLNRPLIVIGTPEYNQVARTIEMALPGDQRITGENPGHGKGVIRVIKEPFGKMTADGRFSRQSEHIGYYFGSCPEVLYIAGPDDEGTKLATYDLIGRIWGTEGKYR